MNLPDCRAGIGDATGRVIDHTPYGFLEWRLAPGNGAEIVNIEVDPAHRRKGHGSRLVRDLINWLPPGTVVFLFCQAGNAAARAFYEAEGFAAAGTVSDLYGPGSDAVVFTRTVPAR